MATANELVPTEPGALPALVRDAATKLAKAETHAEVLDARDHARVAYSAAKSAGRFARAKQAHDEVRNAIYRVQGDALEIEALAKRRLADEYDAAQERGEVRANGGNQSASAEDCIPTVTDIGLTHKDIHEAREVRDAEEADPGIVRRTIDTLLERGEEPTKAAVNKAIADTKPIHRTPIPKVDDEALWLWGIMLDLEKRSYLDGTGRGSSVTMTEPMCRDMKRLVPEIIKFLNEWE